MSKNQKLGTTKLPLQASQAIYTQYWFSSMMSSCIFYIQSIGFIVLLLDFNDFYVNIDTNVLICVKIKISISM